MIKEFVERWEKNKPAIKEYFQKQHPEEYKDIVKLVIENITDNDRYNNTPDPERIHEINDGDYQGTLLYIIAEKGYQPNKYYSVYVSYGSCSGCDTLEALRSWNKPPTDEQIDGYMQLALHIVQGLKVVGEPS